MERQGRSSSDLQKLKSGSHDDLVAGFFNGIGQQRLNDDAGGMSALPLIAAEFCTAIGGAIVRRARFLRLPGLGGGAKA